MSTKKAKKTATTHVIPPPKSLVKLFLPVLIVITTILYYASLNNQFTNLDDEDYITKNEYIKTFHGDSIAWTLKKTFSSYVMGNYHPLTMLTYCIEYEKYQLNPYAYHLTNLALHLLNTLLVFYFIWLLPGPVIKPGGQADGHAWVAFITALLFAIHPMHVESVAWVSERKDVLYSFFYLSALITYILYLKCEKWVWHFYSATFILFILAFLSKAVAVSLPIVFFALDYFLDRKITWKTVLEKVPFVLLSFIFGYIAVKAQNSSGSLTEIPHYPVFDRSLFTCYALVMYLWKLLVPLNLSCLYGYPAKRPSGLFAGLPMYPFSFYMTPFVIFAIAVFMYKLKRFRKEVIFGLVFFLITIALVLQILPVGYAIMADRYSYLPYIGLFFILARLLYYLWESKSDKIQFLKTPSKVALALFLAGCSYVTLQRSKVWHDGITLWTDVIRVNPDFWLGYDSRGEEYLDQGKNEEAIKDISLAIRLKPNHAASYYNRGICFYNIKKYEEALKDYDSLISLRPNYAQGYTMRGTTYALLGKNGEAIKDFNSVILFRPNDMDAYLSRGNACQALGKNEDAIKDYSSVILINPNYPGGYYNRALAYDKLMKYNDAIKDYTSVINLLPDYAAAYNSRGTAYCGLKEFDLGIKDYTTAIRLNSNYAPAYYSRARAYFTLQKFQLALEDAAGAQQLGYPVDPGLIQMIQANIKKASR